MKGQIEDTGLKQTLFVYLAVRFTMDLSNFAVQKLEHSKLYRQTDIRLEMKFPARTPAVLGKCKYVILIKYIIKNNYKNLRINENHVQKCFIYLTH